MYIGAHLSISKGYKNTVNVAREIGCNTFQYFTRNPRGSKVRKLNLNDLKEASKLRQLYNFGPVIGHAPYTINMASPNPNTREFAIQSLGEDIERMTLADIPYLVVHPGSFVEGGIEAGLERIIECLDRILITEGVTILLEGMSGQGSEIGYTFEQLKYLREGTKYRHRVGVVLDTCHLFAAGYDIQNHLDEVLEEFDKIIGLEHLKAFHVNDSQYPLGSRRDRHANLGEGELGKDFFMRFVLHPVIRKLPLILETPGGLEAQQKEIAFLTETESAL